MSTTRRNTKTKRIKWTEEMLSDLTECKERVLEERDSQDKRRQGYMEKMRLLWEEKGYASLGLKAQNLALRDKAVQVIKPREENWQRNEETNVNSEIETSDDTNKIQEQDLRENITVCEVNSIIEEVINANQEFSAEHINILEIHYMRKPLAVSIFPTKLRN